MRCRIYTEVVIDMRSLAVLAQRFYVHEGPVALCKGGGETTTNTYDPVYNAGLLVLQQEQQGWAREYMNLYKYGVDYDPTEKTTGMWKTDPKTGQQEWITKDSVTKDTTPGAYIKNPDYKPASEGHYEMQDVTIGEGRAAYTTQQKVWVPGDAAQGEEYIMDPNYKWEEKTWGEIYGYDPSKVVSEMELMQRGIEAAAELLPLQTQLAKTQIESDQKLVPAQTGLSLAQIEAEMGLVPKRAGLEAATIEDSMTSIAQRAPVREEFYKQALSGVDVNERMNQAEADVRQAFGSGEAEFKRGIFTSGLKLNPNDAAYVSALNQRNLAQTAGIAGARTGARRLAEEEMFNRLKAALGTTN